MYNNTNDKLGRLWRHIEGVIDGGNVIFVSWMWEDTVMIGRRGGEMDGPLGGKYPYPSFRGY